MNDLILKFLPSTWDNLTDEIKIEHLQQLENMYAKRYNRKARTVRYDENYAGNLIVENDTKKQKARGHYNDAEPEFINIHNLNGGFFCYQCIIHEGLHASIHDWTTGKIPTINFLGNVDQQKVEQGSAYKTLLYKFAKTGITNQLINIASYEELLVAGETSLNMLYDIKNSNLKVVSEEEAFDFYKNIFNFIYLRDLNIRLHEKMFNVKMEDLECAFAYRLEYVSPNKLDKVTPISNLNNNCNPHLLQHYNSQKSNYTGTKLQIPSIAQSFETAFKENYELLLSPTKKKQK